MNSNAKDLRKKSNLFSPDDLRQCVETLREGGIVLYPTDTVWGIGCDATNAQAVARIYELKQRTDSKAMLLLVDCEARVEAYAEMPDIAWDLITVSEKPLTIIYPKGKNLAENLLADDQSVGVRVTREAFSKKMCEMLCRPVVSTSANVSGEPTPKCFKEISDAIKNGVNYVVQYRQDDTHEAQPSSILKLGIGGEIKIIRP